MFFTPGGSDRAAEVVQAQWAEIGVTVNLKPLTTTADFFPDAKGAPMNFFPLERAGIQKVARNLVPGSVGNVCNWDDPGSTRRSTGCGGPSPARPRRRTAWNDVQEQAMATAANVFGLFGVRAKVCNPDRVGDASFMTHVPGTPDDQLLRGVHQGVSPVHPLDPAPTVAFPDGPGPHPAVVIGAEAYGINPFILEVQRRLVALGYAVAVPDYYHGAGPTDTEAYDDFAEVVEHIGRLDFTCGARDLAATVDALRALPNVDADRVAVWGYCTGGTLAWLAACLRGDVAAAVLYFPSQPRFHELGPRTPVHPVDLVWQLTCPTLFIYGDADGTMPPELLTDLARPDRPVGCGRRGAAVRRCRARLLRALGPPPQRRGRPHGVGRCGGVPPGPHPGLNGAAPAVVTLMVRRAAAVRRPSRRAGRGGTGACPGS